MIRETPVARGVRSKRQAAALDQPCVGDAPCCLVIVADVDRMALKYGPRAKRYCQLEAGHIARNVLRMAKDHRIEKASVPACYVGSSFQVGFRDAETTRQQVDEALTWHAFSMRAAGIAAMLVLGLTMVFRPDWLN